MLSDDQLAAMSKNAPLLVQEYRKLKTGLTTSAALVAASTETLRNARVAMEAEQTKVKKLEVEKEALEEKVEELKRERDDVMEDRDTYALQVDELKEQLAKK